MHEIKREGHIGVSVAENDKTDFNTDIAILNPVNNLYSDIDESAPSFNLNIEALSPVKLMVIKVKINDITTNALIDTGATHCLIRNSIKKRANLKLIPQSNITIKGIGSELIRTGGLVDANVEIPGCFVSHSKFQVVYGEDSPFPVVLGRKFCSDNK